MSSIVSEGYSAPAWSAGEPNDDTAGFTHSPLYPQHVRSQQISPTTQDSLSQASSSGPSTNLGVNSLSEPRTSIDSNGVPLGSSPDVQPIEQQGSLPGPRSSDAQSLVDTGFDENVLRALCDIDCGVPLLLDRIKQSMVSCREAAAFLKKRASIEEEYGKSLQKLSRSTADTYSMSDGKAGSFVTAWQLAMKLHDTMGDNRLRFAARLTEMSDDLSNVVKEVDKNRKQTKDLANRYERALQESETITEKSRTRLDSTSEELERVLLQKEGESVRDNATQNRVTGNASGKRAIGKAVAKGGMLLKGKNIGNIQRQEGDVRARMSNATDTYRKAVIDTQAMRQEYFNFQLPRILRALKEGVDEVDLGTQYHLARYAFLFETTVLSDGTTLVPNSLEDAPGLKATIESIDNRTDFRTFMQNYVYARGGTTPRGPRRDGPADQGFLPPIAQHLSVNHQSHNVNASGPSGPSPSHAQPPERLRPTFGVELAEQMARDNADVPPIMVKCCTAIEKYGIQLQGIYRLSGTTSKVQKLREQLDRDITSVDLDAEEWSSDINNVTSVIKMWLRDLPDPLMTKSLHNGFLDAAKIENERLRQIRLHERVNDLPDPNYATLKFFLGHLNRINQYESQNAMSVHNLSIVFGPTLFGQMTPGPDGQAPSMTDAQYQNKAIETILAHYTDIFVDEVN